MGEARAESRDADLVSVIGGVLEEFGVTDALTLAEESRAYCLLDSATESCGLGQRYVRGSWLIAGALPAAP